jgi:hypothetical protein
MATKTFYATGAFRYQHRMLTAGEPVQMDGPTARIFNALGKITDRKPRVPKNTIDEEVVPAPIKAPRKRRARK